MACVDLNTDDELELTVTYGMCRLLSFEKDFQTKNTKVLKMEKSVSIFGNGAEPEKQTT
jgi:hypothetical protein